MSQPKWVWVVGVVAALLVVGALADNDDDGTAPRTTGVTATGTATGAATGADEPDRAETCTVPDVVGMVHQTAQDTMQDAGLHRLREQDATGQGRMLLVDRNWTTTAQSVAAGQVVPCDTEVTLSAKKTGE